MISCFNLTVCAQKTAVSESDFSKYQQALNLYNNQQYLAAQLLFVQLNNDTKNSTLNADYPFYSATCAIYLEQNNAEEQLQNFISEFPTSTKLNDAYFVASNYYFEKGDFEKSIKYLDKIDTNQMTDEDLEVINFQKGYAFFKNKNNKEALKYLNLASKSKKYGAQAKYYLGFIAYQDNNFSEANSQFRQLSADDQNKEKLSYFQADMSFKSGKFEEAINQGNLALKKSNPSEQSELNKIIGESYFNLNQFDKALPYLKQYKGQNGKWNNTDFYQLGYTYYKQNDFENAILQFNKIIDGSNLVAQNGYYHLGECYLKTNRKPQAFNAFKSASEMNFDLKIQEDANLNYAKLSYELGNSYQSVPDVLINFTEKYPKNPNNPELEKLLVNSFVSSKNYKQALILLEKHQTNDNKIAYQKVTFYRALELYNEGNFQQATDMLKKSLAEPQDAKVLARSVFWNSEIQYELDNFKEAMIGFKEFLLLSEAKNTPEFKNINYNIGYCYFKQKEYEQAIPFFQAFIDKTKDDSIRICDSYLRIGDCRFVSSKYWPALEAYNKVIEIKCTDADYATFQKALSYGFVNRNDKKINELTSFLAIFPKSEYRDDVLFELANVYVTERKNDLALKTYDQLISELPTGSYTSKSILKQGLIYYNSDKDDLAIAKFKKVAADFPNSPEAIEAVATARLIYVDNGKVNEFAAWIKTLNFVEFSDNELEKDSYNAAEKQKN